MLYQYQLAQRYSKSHSVQVWHGKSAEALFRNWLSQFLPKRFGITSGRIISQGLRGNIPAPHYDVIIYDQLNSPVLWVESNPDMAIPGRILALPAEYVHAVIEVKANLTASSGKQSLHKLEELRPLIANQDLSNGPYKETFPTDFFSTVTFFGVERAVQYNKAILSSLIPNPPLQGYVGGVILQGEDKHVDETGLISLVSSKQKLTSTVGRQMQSLMEGLSYSDSVEYDDQHHVAAMLSWSPTNFSVFAFDLIARLSGTFRPGYLSSFHGISYLNPDRTRR